MNAEIQTILSELRPRFESLYGRRLVRLVVFGSQVRGDAEPGSDIDVLVVLKGKVSPGEEIASTGGILSELSLKFNETICCVFMEEKRYNTRNGPFLRNIRREGMVV